MNGPMTNRGHYCGRCLLFYIAVGAFIVAPGVYLALSLLFPGTVR